MMNLKRLRERMNLSSIRTFRGRAPIILVGSVVGQGIAFLLLPAIAHLYDAAVLGRVASTLAIMNISALVICLQYDQAVIVASDEDLPYTMILSSLLCTILSIVTGLIVELVPFVFGDAGRAFLDSIGAGPLLPPLIFSYGLLNLLWNYHLRKNNVVKVAVGRIVYYGGGALIQVATGALINATASLFITAQIVVSLLAILYVFPWREAFSFLRSFAGLRPTTAHIIKIARSHADFPRYQMAAMVVNAVSIQMPVFALRILFSDTWAGLYFMSMKLLQAPATIVSQAVGQLFYRDSAEKHRLKIEQGRSVENLVGALFRISLIPAVLLFFALPPIVPHVFSEAWQPMTIVILLSLPGVIANFVTSPVSNYLNVRGMQSTMLIFCIVIMAARLIGLLSGAWQHSALVSVAGYSAGTCIGFFFLCRFIVQSAGGSLKSLLRKLLPHVVDLGLLLVIGSVLSYENVLYTIGGLLVLSAGIGFAVYREFLRGGLRRAIPSR